MGNTTTQPLKTSSEQINDHPEVPYNEDVQMEPEAEPEESKAEITDERPNYTNPDVNPEKAGVELENTEVDGTYTDYNLKDDKDLKKEKVTGAPVKKSKRGRKRKHKNPNEGSTDSDSDLFNYDKFLKKVSKKGTRVHVNVRQFAVRTVVPGSKVMLQTNPKMAMVTKDEEQKALKKPQPAPVEKKKVEAPIVNEDHYYNMDEAGGSENIQTPSQKKSNSDYLHAGEDFYNTQGYDIGRYNLRRRNNQKKYYDDDIDPEEDPEEAERQKNQYGYKDDYKQAQRNSNNYNPTPVQNRRNVAQDMNYQSKTKRRKKDDDEDYVAEDDDEYEENEDYSPNQKMGQGKGMPDNKSNFNQMNPAQFGYMGQANVGGQFPMNQQFNPQNQMSKF